MTNAILGDGKGMVTSNSMCVVCGITIGIKAKCSVENCCIPDNGVATTMHVTCARQIGLEVRNNEKTGSFIGKLSCTFPEAIPQTDCISELLSTLRK